MMNADKIVNGQSVWWPTFDAAGKKLSDPTSLNPDSKLSDKSKTEHT